MGTSARLSTTILAMRGVDVLRKAWEMSDKIKIQNVAFFDRQDIGGGWRGRVAAGHGLPQVGRGHPPAGR